MEKSANSTKEHRKGYKSGKEKKEENIKISDDILYRNYYWCLTKMTTQWIMPKVIPTSKATLSSFSVKSIVASYIDESTGFIINLPRFLI